MNSIDTLNEKIIRSSSCSIKLANFNKKEQLVKFINEYVKLTSFFIDLIWNDENITPLLPKKYTQQASTWLSARAIQCAGKQASSIVRGTKKKQSKRLFIINKFKKEGKFKKARKLQTIYNKNIASKPNINSIQPELDNRFFKLNFNNNTSFDAWLTLSSLGFGRTIKLIVPFNLHKHFNELSKQGKLMNSIRISPTTLTLNFEINKPKLKEIGNIIGIDIGQTTTLSCSNGQIINKDNHGHDYNSICKTLSKKKKGSKGFLRTVKHRKNYLNWIVKQIDTTNIKQVNLENLKHLKAKSRKLSHWNFGEFFDVLENHFMKQGVLVNKVNPTYTSQRCSQCGWVRKSNRHGKLFKCGSCSYECDSDLNGSRNIALNLRPIGAKERLFNKNRRGFYWSEVSQENIISDATKINFVDKYH